MDDGNHMWLGKKFEMKIWDYLSLNVYYVCAIKKAKEAMSKVNT
jgi:hypothetical protein